MSVLTVNIGNSIISAGLFGDGGELIFDSSLSADARLTEDEHCIRIMDVLRLNDTDISDVTGSILSSVVPTMTDSVARAMKRLFGRLPIILGPGVKSGLNIRIDNSSELGSDIVAESVAAISKYKPPLVIIDVGSATVLSAIDVNRDYVGCIICPGIDLSINALAEKTALLPQIGLRENGPLIGKNTADSINAGIIYGTAAMIDGLVSQIEAQIGKSSVVATGQYASEICRHCRHDVTYDKNLLLEGLYTIYVKNTQKRNRK